MKPSEASSGVKGRVSGKGSGGGASRILYQKVGSDVCDIVVRGRIVTRNSRLDRAVKAWCILGLEICGACGHGQALQGVPSGSLRTSSLPLYDIFSYSA